MSGPRLTHEQKLAIVDAYERGELTKVIAERFGVNKSYPTLLARRRSVPMRNRRNGVARSEA